MLRPVGGACPTSDSPTRAGAAGSWGASLVLPDLDCPSPDRMAAGPTAARLPPASWEAPSLPPELPSQFIWQNCWAVRQTLPLPIQALSHPQGRASPSFPDLSDPPSSPSPSSFKPILLSNQRAAGSALVPPGKGRSPGLSWLRPGSSFTGERLGRTDIFF